MTIVVGFPPAKDDRSAIELAATLARSSGDDIVSVTVVPAAWPTPAAARTDKDFEEQARRTGEHGAREAAAVLAVHCPEIESRTDWMHGRSVPGALVEYAERVDARMIVIGSGHDGAYGHVHLGSTGDRLLHSSRVPVAVATRGYLATEHGRVTRVTCSFRGDETSWSTLERTAAICAEAGVGLRVVTFAVRGRNMYPSDVGARVEDEIMERWETQALASQQEALARLRQTRTLPEDVEAVVSGGRNWEAAIDRIAWQRDEVLVIGSSSSNLLERLFLGSSGSKIVRRSPVPVIVVP